MNGSKLKLLAIDDKLIGYEDGTTCNRLVSYETEVAHHCTGIIELEDGEDCACHLSAPCHYCMERRLVCSECGERIED